MPSRRTPLYRRHFADSDKVTPGAVLATDIHGTNPYRVLGTPTRIENLIGGARFVRLWVRCLTTHTDGEMIFKPADLVFVHTAPTPDIPDITTGGS